MTSDDLAGRYYCKASVMGFPEVGAEATVYLKGRPTIISHRTQFGIPGDTARVECSAFSIPPPEKVTWSYRGEEIGVGSSDDYSVSYIHLYFILLTSRVREIVPIPIFILQHDTMYSD
jgi:hypothetical protein